MADSTFAFKKSPQIVFPKIESEHPVAWMKRCLDKARLLEQMAVRLDRDLAERDASLNQTEKDYSNRLATADQAFRQCTATAGQMHTATTARANSEQQRLLNSTAQTLDSFHLPRPAIDYSIKTAESTADLEKKISLVAESCREGAKTLADNQARIAKNPWEFGCGGLIAFWFCSILVNAAYHASPIIGNFILFAFLVGPIGVMIGSYVSTTNKIKDGHRQISETAALIASKAQFDCEQITSKSQAEYDLTIANAMAEKKREEQVAQTQRDKTVNSLQDIYGRKYSDSIQEMKDVYITLSQELMALGQGIVRGASSDQSWNAWQPAEQTPNCLRIGMAVPEMPRFRYHLPDLPQITVPALVDYEAGKGIVIAAEGGLEEARQMAQNSILRLLATVPPAGVRFTFIDPVSLGGNVAGFMVLEKYEASLIGGKAWSDTRHIEQALVEVTDHMETVIQKYLREDYKSIAQYNETARVKEAYRIIVVFDFPVNFTETSVKRLVSIMRNGPRCGVFPIIVVDDSKPLPYGFKREDLEQFALVMRPAASVIPTPMLQPEQISEPSQTSQAAGDYVDDEDDDYDDDEEDDTDE